MTARPGLIFAALLVTIGLAGVVRHRTFHGAVTGLVVALIGCAVGLCGVAQFAGGSPSPASAAHLVDQPEGAAMLALVAAVLAAVLLAIGAGLGLLLRRRGTTHLADEPEVLR